MLSVALVVIIYIVSLVSSSSTYQFTDADRSQILSYQNQIRANYGLPALVWDSTLEKNATNYASNCVWAHSVNGGRYGENLAQNSKSPVNSFPLATWMDQINGWYSESQYWTCSTGACGSVCGHLTQIVSLSTTAVGCGVSECDPNTVSSMTSQFLVCQYTPPGNVNLQTQHPCTGKPYPWNGCPSSNPPLTNPTSNPTPTTPPPNAPTTTTYGGCIGDYYSGNPLAPTPTPCHAPPQTFTVTSSKGTTRKLYCDVGAPDKRLWPVKNPNTPQCNYVPLLVDETTSTVDKAGLATGAIAGIAIGVIAFVIILTVVIIIVKKRKDSDERV